MSIDEELLEFGFQIEKTKTDKKRYLDKKDRFDIGWKLRNTWNKKRRQYYLYTFPRDELRIERPTEPRYWSKNFPAYKSTQIDTKSNNKRSRHKTKLALKQGIEIDARTFEYKQVWD